MRLPGPTHPVLGFQYRGDAERFLEQLRERLGKFGLELHPDKTPLMEFGRFAIGNRQRRGEGKPETFNFLGFTHMCGRSREKGYFTVYRKAIGKRMTAKLKDIQQKLRQRRHASTRDTKEWLNSVVRGYFQYHAVPGNEQRLRSFRNDVLRLWLRHFSGKVNGAIGPGTVSWSGSGLRSPQSRSYILGQVSVLRPLIRGKNRVR